MLLSTKLVVFTLFLVEYSMSAPPLNDKALYDPNYSNSRRNHNRRKKPNGNPCRGKSNDNNEQGRTFFDWSFSYHDVNYNYNVNCGGGSNNYGGATYPSSDFNPAFGVTRPPRPILQAVAQQISNFPLGGNNHQPGGGFFGGNNPLQSAQHQVQNIFSNGQGTISNAISDIGQGISSLVPQEGIGNFFNGLGSWLPQNGLFNGQGISSLFQNGLFSGIFDRPSNTLSNINTPTVAPTGPIVTRPPIIQPPIVRPPVVRPPIVRPPPVVTTANPDGQDPDDIIYNDERPVHENHDDVVPDYYNRPNRPGQYLVAYNPIFGEHVQDLNKISFSRIYKQINRELNQVAGSIAQLLL